MKTLSVGFAALLQLLGISLFFKQPEDQCSPAPTLGSWLFLLATLCFLWDLEVYPRRYMHMSKHWQTVFEIIAAVFLAEISTLVIWCALEFVVFVAMQKLLITLTRSDCMPWNLEYWLQGAASTALAGSLLWFILEATDVRCSSAYYLRRFKRMWDGLCRTLSTIRRMNSSDRRQALRAYKMATNSRCRKQEGETNEEEAEYDDEAEAEFTED